MKDEELVSYIVKGKTELFSVIVDRYQSKVFSTVYSYTHDHEETRDLTQEIFIKLYNNLQSYKNKASFSTWLYRIAVNRCIDWTRKKRLQTISTIYDNSDDEIDIYDTIADSGGGPEEAFIKQENKAYIRKVVEDLPEIYKTVIILYYFEDFSPQEISDITDVPKRTIETRLYRGKNLLKLRLEELICGGEKHVLQ
ncbi:MAG TPA: sigma-70 family RNA polymerase sigma factor [Clostridia bacterium]|nr:sigma-70 family RNA polymerase sigma factor [Clostridia bacterium]